MSANAETIRTAMHLPAEGWDDRLPPTKKKWWVFFWAYNLVIALIALAWFWIAPNNTIPEKHLATSPAAFRAEVQAFVEKYETAPGSKVVAVPAGEDAYLMGQMWQWYPTLKLKAGQPTTIWLSSVDVTHTLVLRGGGQHLIFDAVPGHKYGVTITPDQPGEYLIYCAEFCGIGHQDMAGRIIVEP